MKNYILTYCSGYKQHVYDRFIYSLFDTGFKGKLVVFLQKKEAQLVTKYKEEYGEAFESVTCTPTFHPQAFRYFAYLDYLSKHKIDEDSGDVFLCDSKDILFQQNVFNYPLENLQRYDPDPLADIYFFLECGLIGECSLNKQWIQAFMEDIGIEDPPTQMRSFVRRRISCSGSTLGNIPSILAYLQTMCALISESKGVQKGEVSNDQAVHNFLIYNHLLDKFSRKKGNPFVAVDFLDNRDNLVNHMSWGYERGTSRLNEEGAVVNQCGEEAYCFHLYDRIKGLRQKMSKFPQWSKFNLK